MAESTMPDEILARYENTSHEELYQQLMAGDPEQIDGLAAHWRSIHDTVSGLASALRRDLTALLPSWEGAAGQEYQRRVASVVTFAETLAAEFDEIRSGLTTMAEGLREAQRDAESPEETDDHDGLLGGAGAGALAGSRFGVGGAVVGGVIGGITGYNQDEQEKEAARTRTVQLVAQLAAEYRMTEQTNLSMELVGEPEELPVGSPEARVAPRAVPPVTTPTPVADLDGHPVDRPPAQVTPSPVDVGPDAGNGPHDLDGSDPDGSGTQLLGVGDGPLTGAGGTAGSGGLGALAAGGGTAGGGLGAGFAGGGVGARPVGTGLSGTSSGGRAGGLGGAGDVGRDRAATGTQRGGSTSTRSDQRAATRGAGPGAEGETDEYLTWLTEDEMVWGEEDDAPPSVLGATPAPTATPPAAPTAPTPPANGGPPAARPRGAAAADS